MFSADLGGYTAPLPAATDPPFQKVALLLNGDGTNGAQNNTFVDYSYPGGYAVSFDGTGDYLTVPYSTTVFDWWATDYTLEAWIYASSLSSWENGNFPCMVGNMDLTTGSNYWSFGPRSDGTIRLHYWNGSSSNYVTSTEVVTSNKWNHIALTKTSSGVKIWVNGVGNTVTTISGTPQSGTSFPLSVGRFNNVDINGYLSNLRIVKGTALYTSNFTPSNQPLTAVSGTQLLTCQSATIVDNSPNAFTITANGNAAAVSSKTLTRTGNVAQGTFSPFSLADGQWSNYFSDSGNSSLTFTQIDLNADFTVECWLYKTAKSSSGYSNLFYGAAAQWSVDSGTDGSIGLYYGGNILTPTGTAVTNNAWHHIAYVREGTTVRAYVDGVQKVTGTSSASIPLAQISRYSTSGYCINGYVSNVRIVKGTCLYPSGTTFTPPTSALTAITNTSLLTCQSNRFKDNSSNNFTITPAGDTKVTAFSPFAPSAAYSASTNGGSAYFDGSGDYLSTSSIGAVSGDFTIEFWAYKSANGALDYDGVCAAQTGTTLKWFVELSTSRGFLLGNAVGGFTSCRNDTTTGINDNAWHHWAICRSGSSWYLFKDGISLTLTTNTIGTTSLDAGTSFLVGAEKDGGATYAFNGTISNFRAVNGTALYTSNFTPPTAPLTAITNTQLLLNCTNAGIIDNAGKNDIETVGNAQVSTSVKKYGTGSVYLNNSSYPASGGDYLTCSATSDLYNFGTGDFTVEMWLNPTGLSGGNYNSVFAFTPTHVNFTLYILYGKLDFWVGGSSVAGGTATISTGAWTHIAITRSGTSLKMFVNGIQNASVTNSTNITGNTGMRLGQDLYDGGNVAFYGYIDDLRITKGQALYTANFTPPTQAFPNV